MADLVTGGTGFIGSYVVRDLLKKGKEVVCFQRSGVTLTFKAIVGEDNTDGVKIVQGDISNTPQFFDVVQAYSIDRIFHIAYSLPPTCETQPAYALRVNCVGMNNVLEAARLFGLKRVVWTSSGRAFGRIWEFYKEPMGDDDAFSKPDNFYSATKVLDEFMAGLYFENFGTDVIGLRIPRIYGYGKLAGAGAETSEFLREVALNKPVTVGYPEVTWPFLDVEDTSEVIVKASEVPTTKTRTFNVLEGVYSNRKFVEVVRKVNPQAQITMLEGEGGVLGPESRLPEMVTTGAETELGWKPRYSLEESTRKVMNIYRQQAGLPLL